MNYKKLKSRIQDVLLLFIFVVAISQSLGYLIPDLQCFTRPIRYTGLSPNAIAFVHPSFFSPKEIRLHFKDSVVKINPLNHDEYFTNRSSYRAIMFTFDSNRQDVELSLRHTFCRTYERDLQPPNAVEYLLSQRNQIKRLWIECRP